MKIATTSLWLIAVMVNPIGSTLTSTVVKMMMTPRKSEGPPLKPGDIIGFTGLGWECVAINILTYGLPRLSIAHVGIMGEYEGELLLFESTTLSDVPCVIQGKLIDGVQAVRLPDRIKGYNERGGRIWHYPLHRPLYDHESTRLNKFLAEQIGRPYDTTGAMNAGGLIWSTIKSWLHDADLSELFCSELSTAAHNYIGMMRTKNVSRWNPNNFIRYETAKGIVTRPWRLA
ncbi:MAG: hypothetical protein ACYTFQ_23595 [Planctomycetota bacterium]